MTASRYYIDHSRWSDPDTFRTMLESGGGDFCALSRSIDAIIRCQTGASISIDAPFTQEQRNDLLLRSAAELLGTAAERGAMAVAAAKNETCKVGGACRDFALLAVAALRQSNIPARLRVGFADYFTPGFFEDHWVCQWHDGGRWRLLDVECAALPAGDRSFDFDPTDVPSARFLAASDAWAATKDGRLDAARFGVSAVNIVGRWFIAGSLLRDSAAMVKIELKPWDVWGIALAAEKSPDAALAASEEYQAIAERLQVASRSSSADAPRDSDLWDRPESVISYPFGEPMEVRIA